LRELRFRALTKGDGYTIYVTLPILRNVSSLSIADMWRPLSGAELSQHDARLISLGIQGHPNLKSLSLQHCASFLPVLMNHLVTVLPSIPLLEHLSIYDSSDPIRPNNIRERSPLPSGVIDTLLRQDLPRLTIQLKSIHATDEANYQVLCDAIECANVKAIDLVDCEFRCVSALATAVSRSTLKRFAMKASSHSADGSSFLARFSAKLAERLPLSTVEEIDLGKSLLSNADASLLHGLASLVIATKSSLFLKILKLPQLHDHNQKANMESVCRLQDALVDCIRSDASSIEELYVNGTLWCPSLATLADAFGTNFTIRKIRFQLPLLREDMVHVCRMERIARLNAAGRKYVLTDPHDKSAGVQVLSAVSKSLNDIFFHLRENPLLCANRCS
jgi:hypothetical protein